MSWLLGYGRPDLRFDASVEGVVRANGVAVTEPAGRLAVALPDDAVRAGAPRDLIVALRITHDVLGAAVLYVDEIVVAARRYPSVLAWLAAGGARWISYLTAAVHAALAHRVARVGHNGHSTALPRIVRRGTD